ncbi:MAG: LytTR family DNA-binding domain-containing protein [Thermomonas sp.]|uniref:LytR/AlgR family response regulator transcription factor n=1 Tax=Thermomonas sp. TaxID=1971895 RepID=UPI001EC9E30B|nr:LytTR family DNA-binding domain-containing protein [Thermomonas sp.]MBV2208781.1 LytTR family DNA-binding domain-containing protein [Thermomonas sp.]
MTDAPTCLVAEDEVLLRQSLVSELQRAWPALRIVAECEDGASAVEALAEHQPDVAFLDIRMPGLSGLEVAALAVEASPLTQIVFVTAYDQYALDAFEHGAIDYLLKPIQPDRLAATLTRIQTRDVRHHAPMLAALLEKLSARPAATQAAEPLTWLTASTGRETQLILIDDVIYFQAEHKYTTVVTANGEALLRSSLRELLPRLDGRCFKQIHRSTIVNLKAIAGISRDDTGRGTVRLKQRSETLSVSQPFMPLFKQM